jgi:hypothetical protein
VKASLIFLEESFLACYFCLACIRSELAELQCLAPAKVSHSIEGQMKTMGRVCA